MDISWLLAKLANVSALCLALARTMRRLAPLLVIVLGLWSARGLIATIASNGGVDFQRSPDSHGKRFDDDSVRIGQGLDAKPNFASTFGYWTGSWAGGGLGPPTPFGPYYRPLSSQLWWLERAASGGDLQFFLGVHLLWYLAFCLALWATLRMLWNERIALLTLVFWTFGVAGTLGFSTLDGALPMWKDDPEMTVGLCVLGAMAATWHFSRTGKRRFVALGLCCFALGIAFKESAYVTPLFVALTLFKAKQLRQSWRVVALYLGLAAVFYAYRTVVLQGMGGYHGTNASWRQRAFAENIAGGQAGALLSGNALGIALSCALLALFFAHQKRWRAVECWGVAGALCALWSEWNFHLIEGSWGVVLLRLSNVFDWVATPYQQVPLALLLLALIHYFLLRRTPLMAWGYWWVLAAYLPLLHHNVTSHGFYWHSIGWAILLAGTTLSLAQNFAKWSETIALAQRNEMQRGAYPMP